ncbi:glycosyltransferase family 2 protein [Frondihabitans cladoniiphilus]|uniref:Polysaccharide biosynthesis endo-1,4-beta-xylanase UppH n=1 Tax=Frondihabitans cladoniiphilus TaxID=715785 RepID=A0ABP8VXQ0_9MICO
MNPAAGVVIPAYNVESYIGDALESVLAQDFQDWECIVVDDGSTDATANIVAAFTDPRIRLIRQDNAGVSAARNTGIDESRADALLLLDGDDMLHPTALGRLHAALIAAPEAVLVFGTTMRVDPDGAVQPGQSPPSQHSFVSGDVLPQMLTHDRVFWNGGQILARRAVLRRSGGYREGMTLSEDWEFFCRLSALGPCVFIGPQEEILRHRVRPGSTAPRLSLDFANHVPAIDVVFSNPELRDRFTPREWKRMKNEVLAIHRFETGRQHFAQRHFGDARKHMLTALVQAPNRRRTVLFGLAGLSLVLRRPLRGVPAFHSSEPTDD